MRLIFTFFIIIVTIAVLFSLGQSLMSKLEEIISQAQENVSQEQSAGKQALIKSSGAATATIYPKRSAGLINTYITAGPKEGEIIEETSLVTFEFEAEISSKETAGWVSFETKIEGFDDDWKKTSDKRRVVNFPLDAKEYTFLVRAKTSNSIDSTPAKRTFTISVSPYSGKIKISRVGIPSSSYHSVITLKAYLNEEEEINITGWHIKGRRGSSFIPQGIKKYFPGFPSEDILIKKGDRISISGDSSPLGRNKNFRLNKCLGYLAKSDRSSLSIPISCPRPRKEDISHLRACCQEFILRIRGCEVPDYSKNFKISQDSECTSYLKKNFNYQGCFINYSRDEDFLRNNWYIYLNTDIVTSDYCDTIYLRDQKGLLVDAYSYGRDVCR